MNSSTFEAVKEAVSIMTTFSKLNEKEQELILLIQEGLLARQTLEETKEQGE